MIGGANLQVTFRTENITTALTEQDDTEANSMIQ